MTKKDYKLELLAAIENNRDKDALTVTREFMAKKAFITRASSSTTLAKYIVC